MRTKTPKQLYEQWRRISGYVKQRGEFYRYIRVYARYCNRMSDHNRADISWRPSDGYYYTEQNNAPVPVSVYTK